MAVMAGYGIKVQTDTGRFVWLTENGTVVFRTAKGVMRFESEAGAEMHRSGLEKLNPHVTLKVQKF
jgi:hypothetical protein